MVQRQLTGGKKNSIRGRGEVHLRKVNKQGGERNQVQEDRGGRGASDPGWSRLILVKRP